MDSLAEYKLQEYQQSIQELLSNALDPEHMTALSRITNKKELWKKRLRDQWLKIGPVDRNQRLAVKKQKSIHRRPLILKELIVLSLSSQITMANHEPCQD